jgi:hypothetical protein
MPWFSFFQPSMEGLVSLAPDQANGFGGDLGGVEGADAVCTVLAQAANPGDTKTWRAFLSATGGGPDGGPIHAIERIGEGPWFNYNNQLLANDIAGLMPDDDGRPIDTDPALAEMFTDEYGAPVSPDTGSIDNHDTLTGSNDEGRLPMGATLEDTCNDWTSTDESLNPPIVGHAWPRSATSGRHWINEHTAGGCGAGISTVLERGNGTPTVGANGGYGAFYCFAVTE